MREAVEGTFGGLPFCSEKLPLHAYPSIKDQDDVEDIESKSMSKAQNTSYFHIIKKKHTQMLNGLMTSAADKRSQRR